MNEKDVIHFLKTNSDIKWLESLSNFLESHIEYLKIMDEIEKEQG